MKLDKSARRALSEMKRRRYERALGYANSILEIIQNLEDTEEAKEFARLYLKALQVAGLPNEVCKEALELARETDSRI